MNNTTPTPSEESSSPQRDRLHSFISNIPVIGTIFRIANAYVYEGDIQNELQIAPFGLWVEKHYQYFLVASTLTVFSIPNTCLFNWLMGYIPFLNNVEALEPNALIISIIPNLLGFGIGVYALIFGLSSVLVKTLQSSLASKINKGEKDVGSALMLNAYMAYPLLVLCITTIVGVIQQLLPNILAIKSVAWFLFWYSTLMVIQIISVLFDLGDNEILNKLN